MDRLSFNRKMEEIRGRMPWRNYDAELYPGVAPKEGPLLTAASPRRSETIEAVPDDVQGEMAVKLFALQNLTWDYVETVLDLCCVQKPGAGVKKLVRRVRELKREYDRFRRQAIRSRYEEMERRNGERFEEWFGDDFRKLFYGLDAEISRLKPDAEEKMLMVAVQQALTLMEATDRYAAHCDTVLRSYGVWCPDKVLLQREFMELYRLMPLFAGDCLEAGAKTRKLTAAILYRRMMKNVECRI